MHIAFYFDKYKKSGLIKTKISPSIRSAILNLGSSAKSPLNFHWTGILQVSVGLKLTEKFQKMSSVHFYFAHPLPFKQRPLTLGRLTVPCKGHHRNLLVPDFHSYKITVARVVPAVEVPEQIRKRTCFRCSNRNWSPASLGPLSTPLDL